MESGDGKLNVITHDDDVDQSTAASQPMMTYIDNMVNMNNNVQITSPKAKQSVSTTESVAMPKLSVTVSSTPMPAVHVSVPPVSMPTLYPSARNPGQAIIGAHGVSAHLANIGKASMAQHYNQQESNSSLPQSSLPTSVSVYPQEQNLPSTSTLGQPAPTTLPGICKAPTLPAMYLIKQISVNGQQYHTLVDINSKPMGMPPAAMVPLSNFPGSANETSDDELLYVNAKQYDRILKRREARAKLELKGLIPKSRKKYSYESRHNHACHRYRSPNGKFGKKEGEATSAEDMVVPPQDSLVEGSTVATLSVSIVSTAAPCSPVTMSTDIGTGPTSVATNK